MSLVQYAFAIGATGGFWRPGNVYGSGFSDFRYNIVSLFGGPYDNNPIAGAAHNEISSAGSYECARGNPMVVRYRTASGGNLVSVPNTSPATIYSALSSTGHGYYRVCDFNQTIDIRGKLGTYDTDTGVHAADGYLEVMINGEVIFREDDISLGVPSVPGYGSFGIYPAGTRISPPAFGTGDYEHEDGGMSDFYANDIDEYGARTDEHALLNYHFESMTEDQLFDPALPFHWIQSGVGVPKLWPKLSDSSEAGFGRAYMVSTGAIAAAVPPVPPSTTPICDCVPPTGTPKPPGTSPPAIVNPPPLEAVIGVPLSCDGGGLVAIQADFPFSETWWAA